MLTRHISIGVFLVALTTVAARAQTVLYVDQNASGPTHDGSSWCDAYQQVHEALAEAASNGMIDEIRVADGTYLPDTAGLGSPRLATFYLLTGVTLQGGYAGCGAADPDERDIALYETILTGDLNGDDDPGDFPGGLSYADNCYHVVTGSNVDDTGVLDGFTISGGNADGTQPDQTGGGMYTNDGNPTVNNCTFTENSADNDGGGMYNFESSPTLTNCIFSGNWARVDGGGMRNEYGPPPPPLLDFDQDGDVDLDDFLLFRQQFTGPRLDQGAS